MSLDSYQNGSYPGSSISHPFKLIITLSVEDTALYVLQYAALNYEENCTTEYYTTGTLQTPYCSRIAIHMVPSPTHPTLSYMKLRFFHVPDPESGPNIGWVHKMSTSGGSNYSSNRFGNSLTDSTSTNNVFRLNRCTGSSRNTASVESIAVHRTTTSGCSSQKSLASW